MSFRAGFSHLNLETFMPAQNLRASLGRRAFLKFGAPFGFKTR
ncbi:hypothetical protein CAMRE0001_0074 [Campylobacter rectus RM3267]|uniref:Uncharacterized protein n=1 Tax=Campylobacter rectus RM3267 TaxID=553218 RepID=B9CXR3_CAMRE|nr:hypothetical protein CAMRE0001_0074 [Campylobacter rectus RM3267]